MPKKQIEHSWVVDNGGLWKTLSATTKPQQIIKLVFI